MYMLNDGCELVYIIYIRLQVYKIWLNNPCLHLDRLGDQFMGSSECCGLVLLSTSRCLSIYHLRAFLNMITESLQTANIGFFLQNFGTVLKASRPPVSKIKVIRHYISLRQFRTSLTDTDGGQHSSLRN